MSCLPRRSATLLSVARNALKAGSPTKSARSSAAKSGKQDSTSIEFATWMTFGIRSITSRRIQKSGACWIIRSSIRGSRPFLIQCRWSLLAFNRLRMGPRTKSMPQGLKPTSFCQVHVGVKTPTYRKTPTYGKTRIYPKTRTHLCAASTMPRPRTKPPIDQSCLSAAMGSTVMARRAGR